MTTTSYIVLLILLLKTINGYNIEDSVSICFHDSIKEITETTWFYNDNPIALVTKDGVSGYRTSFMQRSNISLRCLNITSLKYDDSGTYKGVAQLKYFNITISKDVPVNANIITLTGRVIHLTNRYCEVKIKCIIDSFTKNNSNSPYITLGTINRWKELSIPINKYRSNNKTHVFNGKQYPLESLMLEVSTNINKINVINNQLEDVFMCNISMTNYQVYKTLNIRELCNIRWNKTFNFKHTGSSYEHITPTNSSNFKHSGGSYEHITTNNSNTSSVIILSIFVILVAIMLIVMLYIEFCKKNNFY
ncbi:36kDa major membrane protein [Murmansk poxvirus]|uniref:36kDa major membrane protein n=1 Tax=Murmansk poxvirus TaxID=2025359 RepID=A0A223FMN0_9POXV|nr:36kDa major membrane protein [Murmansk poxvirus]AST09234.1 36kDa major membrane protein [Murmansk poxvirus]